MSYLFMAKLRYIYVEANINDKLVELGITTVKCFTVQGEISRECYNDFVKNNSMVLREDDTAVDIALFKEKIETEIRDLLHDKKGLDREKT